MTAAEPGGGGTATDVGDVGRGGRGVTRMLFDGVLLAISLAVLLGWAWQGVYVLAPGESAVILRLGAYHRTRGVAPGEEGYWAHLPPPLESHVVVNTSEVRKETFGENPTRSTPGTPSAADESRVASQLRREAIQTADHNVVDLSYVLQYRIGDPYAWAFSLADPASVLHDATEAAMRTVIGKRTIDSVLSQERGPIEREAERLLEATLARYASAVDHAPAFVVGSINLVNPQAPEAVREAFADVVSAGQDEKRATLAAEGDAIEILERARSEAAEIREQAEGYRAAKIVEARGEASRFESLLVEYKAAPEVTRRRLYLEAMESILPKMEKTIVEADALNLWSAPPPVATAPPRAATEGASATPTQEARP